MTKSYLVSFTSSMEDKKVNNVVLVHSDSFEEAVEKIKKRREDMGMPLDEDDQFTNATME
jgi:hypothetical protein